LKNLFFQAKNDNIISEMGLEAVEDGRLKTLGIRAKHTQTFTN